MSRKAKNEATLAKGIISAPQGKVGGIIVSKNGIIRGSVHRKYVVRQKKVDN